MALKKHLLSVAAVCLLTQPAGLRAQFTFITNNGNITITGYTGTNLDVTIPGNTNGHVVTAIADHAFEYSALTNVTFPGALIVVGVEAFDYCSNLVTVPLPKGVATIGDWAFGDCPVRTSVTLPVNLTNIGVDAFGNCSSLTNIGVAAGNLYFTNVNGVLFNKSLTMLLQYPGGLAGSYTVPSSATNIAGGAYFGCHHLTSVAIGSNVTSIGDFAFIDCFALTNIAVSAANPNYASAGGVLFNKAQTVLISYAGGLAGSYAISNSVINVADDAFADCSGLTSLTVGNGVTSIGDSAFFGCTGMTNLALGSSVGFLDEQAFYACTSLTSVIIPSSVTNMGLNVFADCTSLAHVEIPSSLTSIPSEAFSFCSSLTNVIIPGSITDIGVSAFICCYGLKSVAIPDSVRYIGDFAFEDCTNLTKVIIGSGVTNIGTYAFSLCALDEVYFQGNAPWVNGAAGSNDSSVFDSTELDTGYYLPGTTGWGATFGSRLVALWNPRAKDLALNAGVLGFNITGPTNAVIVTEACTNLSNPAWVSVGTNILSGGVSPFTDTGVYSRRFFRFRSP